MSLTYAQIYPANQYGHHGGLTSHSPSSMLNSQMGSDGRLQHSLLTAASQVPASTTSKYSLQKLNSRKRTFEEDPSESPNRQEWNRPFSTTAGQSPWDERFLTSQVLSYYGSTSEPSPTVPASYSQTDNQNSRSMPPPSHPASSLVTRQSFAPPPPTGFAYKRPTIRYGALTNSGLDEASCEPWLSIAFPSKERRKLELCSERVYDMKRWQVIWTTKLILMQNLKDDCAVPCPDDMFREPPYEQDGYTTYRRIWLFADCFLGWQVGQFGLWLFFLDEGTWELQRVMPMSLPLDNDRASALLQEMKSTMLGFAMSDRGKAKVEESWNGLQFGGASSVSFSQASLS